MFILYLGKNSQTLKIHHYFVNAVILINQKRKKE